MLAPLGDVRAGSQAPGTRVQVGPLWVLPGAPCWAHPHALARHCPRWPDARGLTLRHAACHLHSPTWKPGCPAARPPSRLPSNWDSAARASSHVPARAPLGVRHTQQPRTPWGHAALTPDVQAPCVLGGARAQSGRCAGWTPGPVPATSTSQKRAGRSCPSSLRGHNPKSQATPGPPDAPVTPVQTPTERTWHTLADIVWETGTGLCP